MDICNCLLLLPSCGPIYYYKLHETTTHTAMLRLHVQHIASFFRYYRGNPNEKKMDRDVQCVQLANEPGISLTILTPMKIFQRDVNRSTFVV